MAENQEGEATGSRRRRHNRNRESGDVQPGGQESTNEQGDKDTTAKVDASARAHGSRAGRRHGGPSQAMNQSSPGGFFNYNGYGRGRGHGGDNNGGLYNHNGYGSDIAYPNGYSNGRGHVEDTTSPNGFGKGRGRHGDDNWHGGTRGYQGGRDYQYQAMPSQPPWPGQEDQSLKDLLMQVAPQARIAENTSTRLSSKASANILSKVLSSAEAAQSSHQEIGNTRVRDGAGGDSNARSQPKHEEDEESAFMERWSGLFSKGSPLVDGSLEDPFSDLKKRSKIVWKKDRSGHRQRYQERKKQKEKEDQDEQQFDAHYEAGASVVYDASQNQWQPPQTQWQPQRPPGHSHTDTTDATVHQ